MPVSAAAKEAGKDVGIGHALADVGLLAASFIPVVGQVGRAALIGRAAVQGGAAAVKAGGAAATRTAAASATSSTTRSAAARSTAAQAGNKQVAREAVTGKPALSSLTAPYAPKGNVVARAAAATGTAAKETAKGTGRAIKGAWQAAGQEGAKRQVIKKTAIEAGIVAGGQATRLSADEGYRNFVGERFKQASQQGPGQATLAALAPLLSPASDRVAYADYLGQPTYTGKGSKGVQVKTNPDGTPYQGPAGVRAGAFVADLFNPVAVLAGTGAVMGAIKTGQGVAKVTRPAREVLKAKRQTAQTLRDVKKYQKLEKTFDPVKEATRNLRADTKFTEQATTAAAKQGQVGAQNTARVYAQEQAKIAPEVQNLLRQTQASGIDRASDIVGGTPASNMQGPLIAGRNIPGQGGRGLSNPRADVRRGRDGVGGSPRPEAGGGGAGGGGGGRGGGGAGGGGRSGGGSSGTGRQTGVDTSGSSAGMSGQGPGVTNQVGAPQQAGVMTLQNTPAQLSPQVARNFAQQAADRLGGRVMDSSNVMGGVSRRNYMGNNVLDEMLFGTPQHSKVLAPSIAPSRAPVRPRMPGSDPFAPAGPATPARPITPGTGSPLTPGPVQRNWYLPSPTYGYNPSMDPNAIPNPNTAPQPQPQPDPNINTRTQVDEATRVDIRNTPREQQGTVAVPIPGVNIPPEYTPPVRTPEWDPEYVYDDPDYVPPVLPVLAQTGRSGPAGLHRGWWGGTDTSYMPSGAVSARSARMVSNQRAAMGVPSAYTGETPGQPYGTPEAYGADEQRNN